MYLSRSVSFHFFTCPSRSIGWPGVYLGVSIHRLVKSHLSHPIESCSSQPCKSVCCTTDLPQLAQLVGLPIKVRTDRHVNPHHRDQSSLVHFDPHHITLTQSNCNQSFLGFERHPALSIEPSHSVRSPGRISLSLSCLGVCYLTRYAHHI
jgi:hypothetical protein